MRANAKGPRERLPWRLWGAIGRWYLLILHNYLELRAIYKSFLINHWLWTYLNYSLPARWWSPWSWTRRGCRRRSSRTGGNCIRIGLPGKSILGDYSQENRTSRRPFLLLQFSGKTPFYTICLQALPVSLLRILLNTGRWQFNRIKNIRAVF